MLFVVCALCAETVYGQNAATEDNVKPNVFIDYFSGPKNIPFEWIESLRNSVIEGINKTGRVSLIDVDSRSTLAIEKERRESGDVVAGDDMERLKVMTSEGANYLIQGQVGTFDASLHKDKEGKKYWQATCSYTLKVINPADGKLVSTKTFSHGDGFLMKIKKDTKEAAVAELCSQALYSMEDLVEETFKMEGLVIKVIPDKKEKKAESAYINIGSKHGVSKGSYFSVCIENKIVIDVPGGETIERISFKEIGRLEAKVVEAEDLTFCDIRKGKEEIWTAQKKGQRLIVRSMKDPRIF